MSARTRIIIAARTVIRHQGIRSVSRASIAVRARCSLALVSYHFGSMQKLLDAVVEQAVKAEDLEIIAQGLTVRNPEALKASKALRAKAAQCLI